MARKSRKTNGEPLRYSQISMGCGYRLWLGSGNRQYLDDSFLYNEDDCRASKLIKDWMASGAAEKGGRVIR